MIRYTPLQIVRFWAQMPRLIRMGVSDLPGGIEDPLQWLVENAPAKVHDVRAKPGERFGKRGIPRGARTWDQIEGECWHQTAIGPGAMGPKAIRKVPAHGLIDNSAGIWLLWDPRVVLHHANYLNDESIGIEVDCRAAGVEGDESTVWLSKKERAAGKQPSDVVREATDDQLRAGVALGTYYGRLLMANSSDHERKVKVWTHRNGHSSRTTDPGSRIYRGVCEPLLRLPGFAAGEPQGSGRETDPRWPTPEGKRL